MSLLITSRRHAVLRVQCILTPRQCCKRLACGGTGQRLLSTSTPPSNSPSGAQMPKSSRSEINEGVKKRMKDLGITMDDLEREYQRQQTQKIRTSAFYALSLLIGTLALSYAAVPFYRLVCQKTGYAGTPMTDSTRFTPDKLVPVDSDRKITVIFESDVSRTLPWTFVPLQRTVTVVPGETALAFFKATNKSDHDIIGVATYNVTPQQVAPYFSKIQCFCFEQQQLRAGEEVDMPIFFFIDPEFDLDPQMKPIHEVILSYTFFKAKHNQFGQVAPATDEPPLGQITATVGAAAP